MDDSDEFCSSDFEDDSSYIDSDEIDFDPEDYFESNYDIYPKDEKTPNIVDYAGKGLLSLIQRETKDKKAGAINGSRKWTEVEEKWGYDKSWEWHDDTPLIAAARNGHFEVAHYLLSVGADPTLESCHVCDENGNASKAASACMQSLVRTKDQILQGSCSYLSTDPKYSEIAALDIIYRIHEFQKLIDVLKVAEQYWKKASYASSRFSKERKEKLERCPNKPNNEKELKTKLDEFTASKPDMDQLKDLAAEITKLRKKKESQQSNSFNSVFQQLSVNNVCALSLNCDGNPPANDCQHKCCGRCCPGPCRRHQLRSKRDVPSGTKSRKTNNDAPYNSTMKSYSPGNVDAFIQQCTDWDEVNTEDIVLPTGEEFRCVVQKKYFGENHYITLSLTYAFGILVRKDSSLRNECSSMSGSFGNFGDLSKSTAVDKLCRKLADFKDHRRRMKTLQPILEKAFAEGSTYPMIKEDRSLKVLVSDMASFGDLKEAQSQKPQKQKIGGTIRGYVNTVRHFKPGYYYTSVIKPMEDCDPFVMYHHESIDPRKLMDQILLMADDYEDYLPKVVNSINRYDWCEWMHYGGDSSGEDCSKDEKARRLDDRCSIYFCPTESGSLLKKTVKQRKITNSEVIDELSGYVGDDEKVIALGIKTGGMNSGDWIYGKVFEDEDSGQNFALVVNFCLGDLFMESIPDELKNMYPNKKFTSVSKTELKFNIADFEK
ncbi:uncharacterized protein [Clytia hemisphaerica]|uniref:Uncharacterized protein n=1 Tax=Clytia hemisphaerica TaxID=252671 RepID=A0A7M5V797_9CNID